MKQPTSSPPRRLRQILSLDDFEQAARAHLPGPIFAYVVGGAETNQSLRDNRAAFAEYGFLPRVLVGVSGRSSQAELFDAQWSHPFGIAPMGITALSAYRGDLVLARAAARAGVPMIVSGASLIRLEDIIAVNPDAWFQAYLPGDPAKTEALVARIASAGYRTLVITVDTPVSANRENNVRAGFSTPLRPSLRLAWEGITHPRWLIGTFARTLIRHGMPHFENSYAQRGAPIVSPDAVRDNSDRGYMNWHLFERVRKLWKGRILVKGVMDARDAVMARDLGAQGIILSNHGGRQLDGTVSPLRVLPAVVAACPDLPVMIDSGIRRGTDVLKALALGARFVFVGRPFNFAAAIGGEAGVDHAIGLLGSEIARNMALLGVNRVHQLRPEMLMRLGG